MKNEANFDVIIVGGSYSGLAAAMALGRALRKVLVIDGGKPCNINAVYSHNFLTQDGSTPAEIRMVGRTQVEKYDTVVLYDGEAVRGEKVEFGWVITTSMGDKFGASKLIFATGVRDVMPPIEGFAECWGTSVLHCPYCHGYEVRNQPTGVLANGETAFDFLELISNWTDDLILFTNGKSQLTFYQEAKIAGARKIHLVTEEIVRLDHIDGNLQRVVLKGGRDIARSVMYARPEFKQHSDIPALLGCELNEYGYIKVDAFQKTTVSDIFACGDNTSRMRTVANAVAQGTSAGMMANREMVVGSIG